MDRFVVAVHKAIGYVYLSHWTFEATPLMIKVCDKEKDAREAYANMLQELPMQAVMKGTGVRAVLTDTLTNTALEAQMYTGEPVRFHYAAYQAGRRRYIDQIMAPVTYYEAMWPGEGITTVAIAATVEELEYQLGEEYNTYEQLI
jgi:hypothetical protein